MSTTQKYIVILGAAESGVGAAILAKKKGFKVFVSDFGKIKEEYKLELIKNDIEFEEEKHTEALIFSADEIIKSPGVAEKVAIVKESRKRNIPIISEIEFAARYTQAKIIAITGANGKTTTTLLTYHIFKNAGLNVGLGGNVGTSLAKLIAEAETDFDYLVVELSSFQLDDIVDFKPFIAILTNITPDHLDRYEYQLQNYVNSKFKITQNQDEHDFFIYNIDDQITMENMEKYSIRSTKIPISIKQTLPYGAYLEHENLCLNLKTIFTMSIHDLALQGKHNIYNSMAAAVASRIVDIRKESIRESMSDFKNEPHRMEFIAKIQGVEYVNDSKATNINSAWYALESINKPVIWIAGGQDKGNDYSELTDLIKAKVKAIICLGVDNTKIHNAFRHLVSEIHDVKSAYEAAQKSYELAKEGDVVLLSPACASFDLFENYKDRGDQFKEAVKAL